MIILFQNILLLKEFLACNGCFGLFTKIIKRSGTSFCCTFSAWFFYKNVLYLILHLWTGFQWRIDLTHSLKDMYINSNIKTQNSEVHSKARHWHNWNDWNLPARIAMYKSPYFTLTLRDYSRNHQVNQFHYDRIPTP